MKGVLPEGFRVNGTVYVADNVPPLVHKVIAELDKLPFKELVTTRQLAAITHYTINTLQQWSADPFLKDYRFTHKNRSMIFWGSKRTIKELKRVNKG